MKFNPCQIEVIANCYQLADALTMGGGGGSEGGDSVRVITIWLDIASKD